jgi:DNA-binding MarR family transcriptional regulator
MGPGLASEADAVLRASRALVAIAARSLADLNDVTLPQYRALVVLAAQGPVTAGVLARHLSVHVSTVTRLVDRLVARGLVQRQRSVRNRREVEIRLSGRGTRLLRGVTRRRADEITAVLHRMPAAARALLIDGLDGFSDAAGERADQDWALGW